MQGLRELSGKIHDHLSIRVLLPLSRLQRLVRPSRRPVICAYYRGLTFRREAVAWNEERRRNWILNRLRLVLRQACEETEYYRKLFDRIGFDPRTDFSFSDFALLPVLDRDQVNQEGRQMLSSRVPAKQLRRDATGGSTGAPTEIWRGPEEAGWGESGVEHFLRLIGVPPGTRTGLLWGHHLDPQESDSFSQRFHAFERNQRWFDCFRLSSETYERYHREFELWRPTVILAYASALGHLAEHILDKGYQPTYPTKCLITGAEKLWPEHREMIQKAFDRPVHEQYGARDTGIIGFQLNPAVTLDYEIDWANTLIEPETSEPDSPILITKLQADGMPMIRYRVGDLGRFPAASRPGEPTFTLPEVVGRAMDRVWLPDGRWLHAVQFPHLMKDYPVHEFVLLQRGDYSVELQIVPRNGFEEHSRQDILETVRENLPGLEIDVRLVDAIVRTKASKWRPVISEVEESRGTVYDKTRS